MKGGGPGQGQNAGLEGHVRKHFCVLTLVPLKKKCRGQNRANNDAVYLKCLLQEIYI